jgi:hypothetical protein
MSERMTYDPAARAVTTSRDAHDPRLYPDAGRRAALAIGGFVVVMLIVVVTIALSTHRSTTSSTATAPATGAPAQH